MVDKIKVPRMKRKEYERSCASFKLSFVGCKNG